MKPTKNKVFCIGCKHHKMLFESQSKADNFIKFNSDEIAEQTGKMPSRSYYCSFCCGWHITSIAGSDKAAARDERDARVWEQLKQAITSKKKKKQITEQPPAKKTKKFPKSEHGYKLRLIAENIDKSIARIESALYTVDIHKLRAQFDILLNLENELRSKSNEYGINIIAIDKRYENISKIKELFFKVFDFFIDCDKRQSYLSSIPEEDKSKRENIIINNIEIVDRINTCFEHINLLSDTTNQDKIRELCNNILTNLIPQLKGGTNQIKQDFRYRAEDIISSLSFKQSFESHYKGLILTIIGHLEDAHNAYNSNDFEECEACLKQAEILLPDTSNEVEVTLYNQIVNLRNLIS